MGGRWGKERLLGARLGGGGGVNAVLESVNVLGFAHAVI